MSRAAKASRKPETVVRDVSIFVSADGAELFVERTDGSITMALTAKDALAAVKQDDLRIAKRQKAIVITRVTWQPAFVTTDARKERA